MSWITQIPLPDVSALLEILVLSVLFYLLILFFRGTRGASVLSGFILVLAALILFTQLLQLNTLNWILQRFSGLLAIAVVIIFQPEIRRALAALGRQHVFSSSGQERNMIDLLVKAVMHLSERKIGGLIAIEREIGTRTIQTTGTPMDSELSTELLATIFYPNTPLHDGGVILRGNRMVAAGCLFPLSQREELSKSLGTRHRAAIGMTEETDALVVVISEETGVVSVALKGRLSRGLDAAHLRRLLSTVLISRKPSETRLTTVQEQLDLTPEGIARTEHASEEA